MNASIHPHALLRPLILLCLGIMLMLHPGKAHAQSCSASPTSIAFGSVDVVSVNNYSTSGSYTVTCTVGLLFIGTINFSVCASISGPGGTTPRTMSSGTNSLNYNLYSDSAHTTVWGIYGGSPGLPPTNPTNVSVSAVLLGGSASSSPVQIYGYLQSSQNNTAAAGSYTASPSVNLSYNYATAPSTPPSCVSTVGSNNGNSFFSLPVTANVINDCIVTATSINFGGSVGVLTSALSATGTITAKCTNSDSYTIALNKGTTSGASLSDRQMSGSGSAVVHYQLYTNPGHSTIWGDGTSPTSTSGGTGTGSNQNYTVYGLVSPQTTPAPNTYSDTITVTVSY